jgi:hypothetical protein
MSNPENPTQKQTGPKESVTSRIRDFVTDVLPTIDNIELLILRLVLFAIFMREVMRLWAK